MGIANIELFRLVPPETRARFRLMSHPGGLVKYPFGNGGIFLNQLDYTEGLLPGDAPDLPDTARDR